MAAADFDAIPAEHRETARSALAAAFGRVPATELRPTLGGASGALTYRLEVDGRPYLLRVETARDFFRDPARSFACMNAAAEAGIAPPLRHLDPSAGVAIMDFVAERPLLPYPTGPEGLMRDLGGLIARVQALPAFPPLADYLGIVDGLLGFVRGSGIFSPGLLDPHVEGFERIRRAYPWDPSALVSSHNDLNPRNVLFDGERLWLVDWELAFRNDPLVDVAIVTDEFSLTPDLEDLLLRAWLGREPGRAIRARLVLMRQVTRLFYGCIILSGFAAAPRAAPDGDLRAPSPDEFRAAIAEGRLRVGAPETAYVYAKMHLAGFLAGMTAPGFEAALEVARAR